MNRGSQGRYGAAPAGQDRGASMRPRFMNRGSTGLSEIRATLVRESCFNEAPIHESGKCGASVSEGAHVLLASMRPRFMNRGSTDAERKLHYPHLASMRPRFMNRGSRSEVAEGEGLFDLSALQ